MDIIVEEFDGSTWVAAVENRSLQALEIDPLHEIIRWGSIYIAKVTRIETGMNAAYLDLGYEQSGIIFLSDILLPDGTKPKGKKIGQVLKSGQLIAVQVKQATNTPPELANELPLSEKASRMSMDLSFTGRNLILTPLSPKNKVSKRIVNKKLRDDIHAMLEDISSMNGYILRSSAANAQTDILIREAKILKALWDSLQSYLKEESEPTLIMLGPDATQRVLADCAAETIVRIAVSTLEQFQDVEDWCELYAPDLVTKIDPAKDNETVVRLGLFETYGVSEQINMLLKPYLILKSGGNIIIQSTAALTSIDVNQGIDKSAINTNIEAAREAIRQIRIRNLGGILLIDFINMKSKKQRDAVIDEVKKQIAQDSCTIDIHGWTKTGLLEITRARRTPPLMEKFEQSDQIDWS